MLLEQEQPPHPGPVLWGDGLCLALAFLVTAESGFPCLILSLPPQVWALWDPLHRRRVPGLQGLFCGPSQGHRVGKGQCRATLSQWAAQHQLGRRACGWGDSAGLGVVGTPCPPSSPLSLQSISGSDWLNTVAAGDITGELVAAVLPDLAVNPLNVKRSSDRRFVRDHCARVAQPSTRGWQGAGGPWQKCPGPPIPLVPGGPCLQRSSRISVCSTLSPLSPTASVQS